MGLFTHLRVDEGSANAGHGGTDDAVAPKRVTARAAPCPVMKYSPLAPSITSRARTSNAYPILILILILTLTLIVRVAPLLAIRDLLVLLTRRRLRFCSAGS